MKARTRGDAGAAKTLCMPYDQPELPEGNNFVCYFSAVTHIELLKVNSVFFRYFIAITFFEHFNSKLNPAFLHYFVVTLFEPLKSQTKFQNFLTI